MSDWHERFFGLWMAREFPAQTAKIPICGILFAIRKQVDYRRGIHPVFVRMADFACLSATTHLSVYKSHKSVGVNAYYFGEKDN